MKPHEAVGQAGCFSCSSGCLCCSWPVIRVGEVQLPFPFILLPAQHLCSERSIGTTAIAVLGCLPAPASIRTRPAVGEVMALPWKGSFASLTVLLLRAGFIAKSLQGEVTLCYFPRGEGFVLWKLVLCQGERAVVLQEVSAAMPPWREDVTGSQASGLASEPLWQRRGSRPRHSLRNHQPHLRSSAQGWAPCCCKRVPATLCSQPENPSAGKM